MALLPPLDMAKISATRLIFIAQINISLTAFHLSFLQLLKNCLNHWGNQKTLLNDCQVIAQTTTPAAVYQEPLTKTRNRLERRTVEVFISPSLTHHQKWHLLKAVIKVTRFRKLFDTQTKTWQDTHEISFYVSTLVLSAQEFCQAIRNHWGIENRNHYVRDVTMGEDKSRIRVNPHIFAKLRSFALNILRRNNVDNVSLALFDNCMNLDLLLAYVAIL